MIFFDTSAWIALTVGEDNNATAARRFYAAVARGEHGAVVTTNFVLDEAATHIRMAGDVDAAAKFLRSILEGSSTVLVWIDASHFRAALELFERNEDKRWSYTDCTSFVVMQALGIGNAFSFDRNFEQAGFVRLP